MKSAILFYFFARGLVRVNPLTISAQSFVYLSKKLFEDLRLLSTLFASFPWRARNLMVFVMDHFHEVFNLYAEQFAKIPMFPVLQCVHYTIMNLKLRMAEGKARRGVCA